MRGAVYESARRQQRRPKKVLKIFDIIGVGVQHVGPLVLRLWQRRRAPPYRAAGDYTVTLVAGQETMKQPLRRARRECSDESVA